MIPTYAGTVATGPEGFVYKALAGADKESESVEVQNVFYDWECVLQSHKPFFRCMDRIMRQLPCL